MIFVDELSEQAASACCGQTRAANGRELVEFDVRAAKPQGCKEDQLFRQDWAARPLSLASSRLGALAPWRSIPDFLNSWFLEFLGTRVLQHLI